MNKKKIIIAYWDKRFRNLKWKHYSKFNYSKKLRNEIINECIEKGYSVMIRPMKKSWGWEFDGEIFFIDIGLFKVGELNEV